MLIHKEHHYGICPLLLTIFSQYKKKDKDLSNALVWEQKAGTDIKRSFRFDQPDVGAY